MVNPVVACSQINPAGITKYDPKLIKTAPFFLSI